MSDTVISTGTVSDYPVLLVARSGLLAGGRAHICGYVGIPEDHPLANPASMYRLPLAAELPDIEMSYREPNVEGAASAPAGFVYLGFIIERDATEPATIPDAWDAVCQLAGGLRRLAGGPAAPNKTVRETEAAKLSGYFTTDNPRGCVALVDDAPEWLSDAIHAAHGDGWPNDWTYEACQAACDSIAEYDGDPGEDWSHEWADGQVDTRTHDLLAWLAADIDRAALVDEACEELCVERDAGIVQRISNGQYVVYRNIADTIGRAWEEYVTECEDAAADEEGDESEEA